ncbi:MAG: 50S ribosomal protein L29 [Synechococcaceae cyanobacterium RL_1_2]|nr:50S ribosomal protein L29 [Synechococcaceae cyanobacterium RL_1_2]
MALPKIQEVRELNDEQLAAEIVDTKKQLFDLRLKQATQQLDKPHLFKHTRHRLAQLLTVETERGLVKGSKKTQRKKAAIAKSNSLTEEA